MTEREKTLENYRAAARGEVEIHFWSGNASLLMKTVVAKPGEEVPENGGLPSDFAQSQEVVYSGIMPQELVEERLNDLQSASE